MAALPGPDLAGRAAAQARDSVLTKPRGALGRLETLAIWVAGWQGTARPRITAPQIIVFAGNHGIAARGVSAFPAAVTAQMVAKFMAGGAAINQLAASTGAKLDIVALDLDRPTTDFTTGPAMTDHDLTRALAAGWQAVDPAADLLVVGEMGIANSTSAAALACALYGGTPEDWIGRGTGVDDHGLQRKAETVRLGLARHQCATPLEALRCLGGRELAAMAGAIARARHLSVPVILDGFICTAAAAVLDAMTPGALDHCLAGHVSQEPGHARLLEKLGKAPLLALDLRLGEGSGGALAISIVKAATACHSDMATFAEAGVADV
ncbi:MAG: nicotinate-nucleotide--dimethylbenzimidazole phosphoribosyltransferase [Gemmobacter sp.]|nr:nicotinate-nucleotide--dimethylbenzimidazole phosphoribosyltransferase [Gemmobacter sp.]